MAIADVNSTTAFSKMPRKAFVADLQEAVGSNSSARISNIKNGDEDGSLTFTYMPGAQAQEVAIQALVPGK